MKNRLPQILSAIAWIFLVTAVSFLPYQLKQDLHTRGRLHLWYHLLAFAIGALLLANAVRSRRAQITSLITAFLIGCFLELGQHAIYHTQLEVDDILMDGLGLMLGTFFPCVWRSCFDDKVTE